MFLFYIFHLKDLLGDRNRIHAEIKKLELSVTEGITIENPIRRLEQELAQMEGRFEALKTLLPERKEIPAVLRSLQRMAASSNLTIIRLTPKPVVPRPFYSEWPVHIEVQGNYDGLCRFFEKVGRASRIIKVDALSIKSAEKRTNSLQTLTASCMATTFVFGGETQAEFPDESGMHTDGHAKGTGE
jgi:Tfp pilus assembly protein PilO